MVLKQSILLLAACLLIQPSVGRAEQPFQVRALSYNIHHGAGVDGKLDLKRIAGVIKSAAPDVVAVQEVDKKTRRTGEVDQAAELARLTEMHVVFGGNIRFEGGDYGNAVLSRWPIKRHANHLLPSFDDGEQRGVLEVELELPGGREPLLLYVTHLDYRPADEERFASAAAINALAAKSPGRAAILAGDLNDVPGSRTLRRLEEIWVSASRESLPTVPVGRPARQIDFVLVRPAERWRVVETRVLDEAVASDHRPILAVLELLPE
ncbi:MAG: endonuclease/exonuclease/phosphatase family protein [Planctomycetes bacterium]|nr:endonuclease/exonuclease/phosphatase family protein [Planctomycetota bacterium]